jgi:hypothetical protein
MFSRAPYRDCITPVSSRASVPSEAGMPEDANPEDANPEDANPEDANPEDANPEDANPEDGRGANRGLRVTKENAFRATKLPTTGCCGPDDCC